MTSRGTRLGGYGEIDGPLRRPGEAVTSPPNTADISIETLEGKIRKILPVNIDPILLHEIEILFKQLCPTGEAIKDILERFHSQALCDSDFGEKSVIALEQLCTFEIDHVCVRSVLLTCIENDFMMKETWCHSDRTKFIGALMLLGNVFNIIKVEGTPIHVLGDAILDYFYLLLENDDYSRVFTKQLLWNHNALFKVSCFEKRIESLKYRLREVLISPGRSLCSKCWILLALDYIANDMKPLSGIVRDFYFENLGSEYLTIEREFNCMNIKIGCHRQSSRSGKNVNSNEPVTELGTNKPAKSGHGISKNEEKEKPVKNLTESKSPEKSGSIDESEFYGIQINTEDVDSNSR